MKRTLLVVAIALGFATAANAASVTLTANKTTYTLGETIFLSFVGNNTGESASQVYARVTYDAFLTDTVSSMQTPHKTQFGGSTWTQQPTGSTEGAATMLSQIAGITPGAVQGGMSFGTATLVAANAGVVNVAFIVGGPSAFDYFGLTNAAGTSFTIVPEPTVATLIGLGLVGLAVSGRRRSS